MTASLRRTLKLLEPAAAIAAGAPTAPSSSGPVGGRIFSTMLRTGYENTPLYLTLKEDGGATMTASEADLAGSTNVVDDELTQVASIACLPRRRPCAGAT